LLEFQQNPKTNTLGEVRKCIDSKMYWFQYISKFHPIFFLFYHVGLDF
jgi:hypothetical protein